jgi:PLP dependent protein
VSFGERHGRVRERMAKAAQRAGRSPSEVRLVAVAKGFGPRAIQEAIDAGVTDVGENRAQDLQEKAPLVDGRVTWHFVGHLQRNKVTTVVGTASLIHSLDRMSLAEAIARRARSSGITQDVLVQVNVAAENTKHGVEPPGMVELAVGAADLDWLVVKGLMTIPPLTEDPERARPYFWKLAQLRGELIGPLPGATELSMGMSRDFEVAIEEGATMVRVGEALFGPRPS